MSAVTLRIVGRSIRAGAARCSSTATRSRWSGRRWRSSASALGLAFNLFGIGIGLLTLLLDIYEVYLIAEGFERLHLFTDPNQKWITAVVMIVASILTAIVLGILLGGLFVAGALPFAL